MGHLEKEIRRVVGTFELQAIKFYYLPISYYVNIIFVSPGINLLKKVSPCMLYLLLILLLLILYKKKKFDERLPIFFRYSYIGY